MKTIENIKYDLTTIDGVKALMSSSRSEEEWNSNCDKVKSANGDYPYWWYGEIVLSGLLDDVYKKWQK